MTEEPVDRPGIYEFMNNYCNEVCGRGCSRSERAAVVGFIPVLEVLVGEVEPLET